MLGANIILNEEYFVARLNSAHYSQRWPLRTSPSCRVSSNAMPLISGSSLFLVGR